MFKVFFETTIKVYNVYFQTNLYASRIFNSRKYGARWMKKMKKFQGNLFSRT